MRKDEFEKIEDLLENDSVQDQICNCKNAEEFKSIFTSYGISFEEGEADIIYDELVRRIESGEELSEEELLEVSGGGILAGAAIITGGVVASYILGRIALKKIKKMAGLK